MTEIRIYVEGGGPGKDNRGAVQSGFGRFLAGRRQAARERGIGWQVVACGSRPDALRAFGLALHSHPDAFNLLLVDSDSRVQTGPWEHLRRQSKKWAPPRGMDEMHCHLMVQVVEAWLIADAECLAIYYGQGFQVSALPGNPDVEVIEKDLIFKALDRAIRETQKKKYHKIVHCSELLAQLDPDRVRKRARHCDRLFRTLTELIEGSPEAS